MAGEESFDMEGALAEISDGLGFGEGEIEDAEVIESSEEEMSDDAAFEQATDETEATGEEEAPAEEAAAADKEVEKSDASQLTAPRTWRSEAAAEFSKLPPVVQQEILKREEDIFKGIEAYKEDATFGKSMHNVLSPYLPVLKQYNIAPESQVADMMKAHYTLAFGEPQAKLDLLRQVAKDYNIPLDTVSSEVNDFVDPQVADLQKQITHLQSQLTGQEQQRQQARQAEVVANVEKFMADPANVYANEVVDEMASLLSSGAEKDLKAAYDKAVWMNPVTRAKEIERQQAEKSETARLEAEAKAAKAKEATAANVRAKAKSGRATAPTGSMEDTLAETLAAIQARG